MSHAIHAHESCMHFHFILYSPCSSLVADDMQRAMSGTLLISHPIRDRKRYINGDKFYRDTCCPEATGNNGRFLSIFCQFYFRRRPVLMSEEMYVSPDLGSYIKITYK